MTKIISYYTNHVPDDIFRDMCTKLSSELDLSITKINDIQDFFPLLSQSSFHTDYIVVDVDDLYNIQGVDGFDVIKTLSTLISCTVYRDKESIKVLRRNTKIVALIGEDTKWALLQEILSMPEVHHIALRSGKHVGYDLVKRCVENYISGGERAPKYILNLIKQRKINKSTENELALTTRQQQVLSMIVDRGASNKNIAKTLKISESTVKMHISGILKKYRLRNRTQLAVFAKIERNYTEV